MSGSDRASPPAASARWFISVCALVTIDSVLNRVACGLWLWLAVTLRYADEFDASDDASDHDPSIGGKAVSVLIWIGAASVLHQIVYGTFASAVPKSDESFGRDRAVRMSTQGGHTLMLCYFAGLGTVAECVQLIRSSPAASASDASKAVPLSTVSKIFKAAKVHAVGNSILQLVWHTAALGVFTSIARSSTGGVQPFTKSLLVTQASMITAIASLLVMLYVHFFISANDSDSDASAAAASKSRSNKLASD